MLMNVPEYEAVTSITRCMTRETDIEMRNELKELLCYAIQPNDNLPTGIALSPSSAPTVQPITLLMNIV